MRACNAVSLFVSDTFWATGRLLALPPVRRRPTGADIVRKMREPLAGRLRF